MLRLVLLSFGEKKNIFSLFPLFFLLFIFCARFGIFLFRDYGATSNGTIDCIRQFISLHSPLAVFLPLCNFHFFSLFLIFSMRLSLRLFLFLLKSVNFFFFARLVRMCTISLLLSQCVFLLFGSASFAHSFLRRLLSPVNNIYEGVFFIFLYYTFVYTMCVFIMKGYRIGIPHV